MMNNNFEMEETGIRCDFCPWEDKSVKQADYVNWINKPCPKCGANLMTQTDYENHLNLMMAFEIMRNLTPAQMDELIKKHNPEDLIQLMGKEQYDMLMSADADSKVSLKIDTHEKIAFIDIEIEKDGQPTEN